jgi:monoamine oxidase
MSRSPHFSKLRRALRVARFCHAHGLPTAEGLEMAAEIDRRRRRERLERLERRRFLKGLGASAALGAAGALAGPSRRLFAAPPPIDVDVGIVGAGLAGLSCADALAGAGVIATVYEGRERNSGRVWSMGGSFPAPVVFPGQVVERGGELIDNLALTMKSYARAFNLDLEDLSKEWRPGEEFWYLNGELVSEETVVDEWRDLVDAIRPDMTQLSAEITPEAPSDFDVRIDNTNLLAYLERRGAGANIKAAIDVSYTTEYGREIVEQSALNLLFFMHIDKRSRFTPFGVFSDERYHVIEGNQNIPEALAQRFGGVVHHGHRLVAVTKLADERIALTFDGPGGGTTTAVHDAVVLTLPFSALREVDLDASLNLPPIKVQAIETYLYGTNAKMHVGFNGRFWTGLGNNGLTWSNLRNHQNSWEPNPIKATETDAVLLDYSGGQRGAGLNPNNVNHEAKLWLLDLDLILPGAFDAAKRTTPNRFLAHLQHWPSDPFIHGSYTCNAPGYFTTISGFESTPVGNLYFAGEHTDSFYEWQGFMKGAANSGIRAANEILADFG